MVRREVANEDLVNTSQLKSPYTHNRYNAGVKVFLSVKNSDLQSMRSSQPRSTGTSDHGTFPSCIL